MCLFCDYYPILHPDLAAVGELYPEARSAAIFAVLGEAHRAWREYAEEHNLSWKILVPAIWVEAKDSSELAPRIRHENTVVNIRVGARWLDYAREKLGIRWADPVAEVRRWKIARLLFGPGKEFTLEGDVTLRVDFSDLPTWLSDRSPTISNGFASTVAKLVLKNTAMARDPGIWGHVHALHVQYDMSFWRWPDRSVTGYRSVSEAIEAIENTVGWALMFTNRELADMIYGRKRR